MVLLQLAASVKALFHLASQGKVSIDSPVFRLHYKTTAGALILCSLLVSTAELIGKAIECVPGSKLPGQGAKAATHYCFVQHTFSVRRHFADCGVGEVCTLDYGHGIFYITFLWGAKIFQWSLRNYMVDFSCPRAT
jgi:hypothetical protein